MEKKLNVQIIGMFNSGTNLLAKIISCVFDAHIHNEGHTHFWKHTTISKPFSKNVVSKFKNTIYVIIAKNPYFQFHSLKKSPYSIRVRGRHPGSYKSMNINIFVKKSFFLVLPHNVPLTDRSTLSFSNFPDYWNRFYGYAHKHLNDKKCIFIRYEDLLFNIQNVISNLQTQIPLKAEYTDPQLLQSTIDAILNTPAKDSGNSRYGNTAKQHYSPSNIPNLYNKKTFNWINAHLDGNVLKLFSYSKVVKT